MKLKKILLTILLFPVLIACGPKGPSTGNDSSSRNRTSRESISTLSTNPVSEGCSISGSLIEISTGCYLQENDSYKSTVKPSEYTNPEIKVVSSNEDVFTVRFEENSKNTFYIDTHKAGDSIIKIYAAEDDYLIFREVVHVRKAYDKDEIQDVVFDTYDIWTSTHIMGVYQMTFFTVQPLSGLLNGSDDMENTKLRFSLTYVETKKMFDFTFHSFAVELDLENSQTRRKYTEVDIATTGDNILFYYEEGLLEMFRPIELYNPTSRY